MGTNLLKIKGENMELPKEFRKSNFKIDGYVCDICGSEMVAKDVIQFGGTDFCQECPAKIWSAYLKKKYSEEAIEEPVAGV